MITKINYKERRYFSISLHGAASISIIEGSKNVFYWDLIDIGSKGIHIAYGEKGPKWMDQDMKGRLKIIGVDLL